MSEHGSSAEHQQTRSAAGDRSPWLIAVVVSIATFMQVLDTSIANVALRHIAGSLAAGIDESTWIITTYLVASAVIATSRRSAYRLTYRSKLIRSPCKDVKISLEHRGNLHSHDLECHHVD